MTELHPSAAASSALAEAIGPAAPVLDRLPAAIGIFSGPELRLQFANPPLRALAGGDEIVGRTLHELRGSTFRDSGLAACERLLRQVAETGVPARGDEAPAPVDHPAGGRPHTRYWDFACLPLEGAGGTVVGVILHAIEVTEQVRARQRAEAAEHLYRALVDSDAVGVTITDEERILEANDAFLEMLGYTRADLAAGLRWRDLTAPEHRHVDQQALRHLHDRGVAPPFEKEYLHRDGRRVPVLLSGTRVGTDPFRVLATIYDQTDRRSVEREVAALFERERDARFAAEMASARIARLQEITGRLSAARSPEQIAEVVVGQAMEDLSAPSALLATHEGGYITIVYKAGYDEGRMEPWERYPVTIRTPIGDAIHDNRIVIVRGRRGWQELYPQLQDTDLAPGGLVAVPLAVGDSVLGGFVLAFRDERELSEEDLEFLGALAQQAAASLDRAQLYANRVYVARKLQEGLLPQRLPAMQGLEVAVRYASIAGGGEVGGDFYDLFETGPDRWAFAVGDVCGKGTEAAVVTGLARHTIRAVAWLKACPVEVLSFLNLALRRHADVPSFCTVACGFVDASGASVTVRLAAGGHPSPLLLRADGAVERIAVPGTMLGVDDRPRLIERTVGLEHGEALVLYTDGVTDARRPGGEPFGDARLEAAVASAHGGSADDVAAAVEDAVRAHYPEAPVDDRAVLVLRRCA